MSEMRGEAMSDYSEQSEEFDNLLKGRVEQFNQQVEETSGFHRQMLKALCAERIRKDFEGSHNPPVRIRVVQPSQPRRPITVGSILRGAGKVSQLGKRMAYSLLSKHQIHQRQQSRSSASSDPPNIIEGEYTVILDEGLRTTTEKEEQQ